MWLLPTILFSNHPGHAKFLGHATPPDVLAAMVQALDENLWLGDVAAILTGYMPSAEHAAVAAGAVNRVRDQAPWAIHLCDPAMGDNHKRLYIDEAAAEAVRLDLMPLADIVTPNQFELEWLTKRTVANKKEAIEAAGKLGPEHILITSMPTGDRGSLGNLLLVGKQHWLTKVARRNYAPHGTGDLMAALYLAHMLHDDGHEKALTLATAGVEAALKASGSADELQLVNSPAAWADPQPWPLEQMEE